jgi:hypothetical protein
MIAPLSINSSHTDCRPERSFFSKPELGSARFATVSTAPGDQPRQTIAGDLGQLPVLAEVLNQQRKVMLGVDGGRVMLSDFQPVAIGNVIEP